MHTVEAADSVAADGGKMAVQRGPSVYCAEWADNGGRTSDLILPLAGGAAPGYDPALLHGVMTLSLKGKRVVVSKDGLNVSTRDERIVVIPYYAWANRGKGEMNIWFPERVRGVELLTKGVGLPGR